MKILLLAATFGYALAQEPNPVPDVDQIMSRVALNQAKSQEQRKEWVYNQKQLLRMVRGNGKVAREERREYVVTPRRRRIEKQLVKFEGKYESHGKYIAYDRPGYEYKGVDIDGDIINDVSEDMTNAKDSRDGLDRDLFPLTESEQKKYDFTLKGTETYRGRTVFRVTFQPKPHPPDGDGGSWKGDALIDADEYQPVLVTTGLAFKIPMAVKILLGTNVKGLGFSVAYQKFADGVWFPVSYGGEFEVRAVFFYKRTISVSMTNGDFRRTDVTTKVAYAIDEK
ncbi:MAG: hypothetical protein LAQ69_26560 [Acidobacteriia bacterium]|nr:hypothetical protein [Terriglobia bacterium]